MPLRMYTPLTLLQSIPMAIRERYDGKGDWRITNAHMFDGHIILLYFETGVHRWEKVGRKGWTLTAHVDCPAV